MTNADKQCSSCGGFCGKLCERKNIVEPTGCAECGNKGEDGCALYCLSCIDKMRVKLTEAQITELLSKVSVDGSYATNLVRAVEIYHGVRDD